MNTKKQQDLSNTSGDEKSEEFLRFEQAMKQIMNMTPEQVEAVKKAVPYPSEELSQEEYDKKISIYDNDETKNDGSV